MLSTQPCTCQRGTRQGELLIYCAEEANENNREAREVIALESSRGGGKGLLAVHNKPPNLSTSSLSQEVTVYGPSQTLSSITIRFLRRAPPPPRASFGSGSAPGQLYFPFALGHTRHS